MLNLVLYTNKIRFHYPKDRQQPKSYRIQVGRLSNNYYFTYDVGNTTFKSGGDIEFAPEHFIDANVTGIYYVKCSVVHHDGTVASTDEFTVNVAVPIDAVIPPIIGVY